MVDFVKIYIKEKDQFEQHIGNKEIYPEIRSTLEEHSGEIEYPRIVMHEGLELRVTAKSGSIQKSLHKHYNLVTLGEDHNHNDFSAYDLKAIIERLEDKVECINQGFITQLEFGINVSTVIPAKDLINRAVLMHKLKGANHNRFFQGRGTLKQFDYNNHVIKIYDKGQQYKLRENILRFEVRFTKAKELQMMDIFHLEDLKKKPVIEVLFKRLRQHFEHLTIIDPYEGKNILEKDKIKLDKYCNPQYWEVTVKKYSPQTKSRHKKEFEALQEKYQLTRTKQTLLSSIDTKYQELITSAK